MEIHITYPTTRCIPSCVGGSIEVGEQVRINLLPDRGSILNWPDFVVGTVVGIESVEDAGGYVYEFAVDVTQLYPVDPNTGEPDTSGEIATPSPCDFGEVECYSCCQDILDRLPELIVEAIESEDLFIVANAIRNLVHAAINDPNSDIYDSLVELFNNLFSGQINDPDGALKALIVACTATTAAGGLTESNVIQIIEDLFDSDSTDLSTAVGAALKAAIEACLSSDSSDFSTVVGEAFKAAIEACLTRDAGDANSVVGGILANLINTLIDSNAENPDGTIKALFNECLSDNLVDPNGTIKVLIETCVEGLEQGGVSDAEIKTLIENCLNDDAADTSTVVGAAIKSAIESCFSSDADDVNSALGGALKSVINSCFNSNLADNLADPNGSIKALIQQCIDDSGGGATNVQSGIRLSSRESFCNTGSEPVEFTEMSFVFSYSPASLIGSSQITLETAQPGGSRDTARNTTNAASTENPPNSIIVNQVVAINEARISTGSPSSPITLTIEQDSVDATYQQIVGRIGGTLVDTIVENNTDQDGGAIRNVLLVYSLNTPFIIQPGTCRGLDLLETENPLFGDAYRALSGTGIFLNSRIPVISTLIT